MEPRPPRIVRRLYQVIVALAPRDMRARFGDEQMRLFDEVWREGPSGTMARLRWSVGLLWTGMVAAVGAHRDRWHRRLPVSRHGFATSPGDRRTLFPDLRYAVRGLARAPWFTVGAVLTFAIGIGLNLAVFSLVDRVLFRPLPFHEPHRLVALFPCNAESSQCYTNMPKTIAVGARRRTDLFEDVGFVGLGDLHHFPDTDALPVNLVPASANALDVLGVRPVVGRGFTPDDVVARRVVALLNHDVWRDRFGRSPNAIGRVVAGPAAPKQVIEIVGVLPAGFVLPSVNGALGGDGLVLDLESLESVETPRAVVPGLFARLQPAIDIRTVQEQINGLIATLEADRPAGKRSSVRVAPLRNGVFYRSHTAFTLLFASASLVWLLGIANLSSLMLARARGHDMALAIRRALGATRWQLLGTSLTEALLVCGAGTIVALLILKWALAVLPARVPVFVQTAVLTDIDGRIVFAAFVGAIGGALLAGILPARRAWRLDPLDVLKRGAQSGRRSGPAARRLLMAEAALGTVLVCGAVLSVQSLVGLLTTDLGFKPAGLYAAFGVPAERSAVPLSVDERFAVTLESVSALRRVPGVTSASAASHVLFRPEAPGFVSEGGDRRAVVRRVLQDYFEVMGTPVVAGRVFSADEIVQSAPVTVMSAGAASAIWPALMAEHAVGQTVRFDGDTPRLLIGVVADTRKRMADPITPEVFTPASPRDRLMTVFRTQARAGVDALTLERALESVTERLNNVVVTSAVKSLDPVLEPPRLYAEIFGTFALVAMVLGAVGLFSIANGDVASRTYELGIRLTLGASPADVRRLVMIEAVRPVAIGVAMGLVGTWWVAPFMQAVLHDVDARSPITFAIVAGIFLTTALVATWRPALRAGRTDPACILRAQ